jgi:hypothetical protein
MSNMLPVASASLTFHHGVTTTPTQFRLLSLSKKRFATTTPLQASHKMKDKQQLKQENAPACLAQMEVTLHRRLQGSCIKNHIRISKPTKVVSHTPLVRRLNAHGMHAGWEFTVEVIDDRVRRAFIAHTDMTWRDFMEKSHQYFNDDEVRLAYRLCSDRGAMTYLGCESDWHTATRRVKEKAVAARTRAVAMELKNMVSDDAFKKRKRQLTKVFFVLADTGAEGMQCEKGKGEGKALS